MAVSRRSLMKMSGAAIGTATVGLSATALGAKVRDAQARGAKKLKLSGVKEFTTACNFCSCGCGIVCQVKDGKLVNLEGDPDHVINEGALCSKGAAMMQAHVSPQRATQPLYRAPGASTWTPISWDEALDRVARKVMKVRDENWTAHEAFKDQMVPVNRTDAIGFLGGAQNTNEECYLFAKMARLFGTAYVEHQARL